MSADDAPAGPVKNESGHEFEVGQMQAPLVIIGSRISQLLFLRTAARLSRIRNQ